MNHYKIFVALLCLLVISSQVPLASGAGGVQDKVAALQKQLEQQREQGRESSQQVTFLQGELGLATENLAKNKQEKANALKKLQAKHKLLEEYPEISFEQERKAYAKAKNSYDAAAKNIVSIKHKLSLAEQESNTSKTLQSGLETELQHLRVKLDEQRFAILRQQMEQEKTVDARGEVGCGSESITKCKELALQDALRQATEQGSAILVDSSTEVKDGRMEKDLIRSRVRAVILRHEVLSKGWVSDTSYYYNIRAVVKGQVSPALREQFLGHVVTEQAVTDSAAVSAPSSPNSPPLKKDSRKTPPYKSTNPTWTAWEEEVDDSAPPKLPEEPKPQAEPEPQAETLPVVKDLLAAVAGALTREVLKGRDDPRSGRDEPRSKSPRFYPANNHSNIVGEWSTDYGRMWLIHKNGNHIAGRYNHNNGRIFGKLKDSTLIGLWVQSTSDVRCRKERKGSRYWGGVVFDFHGDSFNGKWSYCARRLERSPWNGRR